MMNYFLDNVPSDPSDSSGPGTDSEERKQKNVGGRPSPIDEETLLNRRNCFIGILSPGWGDIGWLLSRARTRPRLRKALGLVQFAANEQLLKSFLLTPTIKASRSDIQKTRKSLSDVVTEIYDLIPNVDRQREHASTSGRALIRVSAENLEVFLDEHFSRLTKVKPLDYEMSRLQAEQKMLEEKLTRQEAYVAQTELVKFVGSGKYAHNPRNLAYAMAGLPELGCWQSFNRCARQRSPVWPTWTFGVFEIIAKCWDRSESESSEALLASLEKKVRTLPKNSYLRNLLSDNWRNLRQAVEQTRMTDGVPTSVPYRLFASFMRNLGNRGSDVECLRADQEKLDRNM
jgi:hypothetical protein